MLNKIDLLAKMLQVSFSISNSPVLCPLKCQLCQDDLLFVNDVDSQVKVPQSWSEIFALEWIEFAGVTRPLHKVI